jgi:hypothetical protein
MNIFFGFEKTTQTRILKQSEENANEIRDNKDKLADLKFNVGQIMVQVANLQQGQLETKIAISELSKELKIHDRK